jgi:hypothetical protein
MSNRLNRKTSVQLLQTIQDRDEAIAELLRLATGLRTQVKLQDGLLADRDAAISALTSTNNKLQALVDAMTAVANDAVKPLPISEPATEANPNGDAQQLIG